MTLKLTKKIFTSLAPKADKDIVSALVKNLPELFSTYEINTPLRVAHFLGQTAHESWGFTRIEENLNYSAERLKQVFPRHFRVVDPKAFEGNPEKIGNYIYANRLGNSDFTSGDGFRYRGRDLIQLTGKYNYQMFGNDLSISLEEVIALLESNEGIGTASCWFWNMRNLNQYADQDNVYVLTRKINGGTHGLESRKKYTDKAKSLLKVK